MVKVRGRNSNGKTVKQTAEKLARASICDVVVPHWCHLAIMQGHATDLQSRSAGAWHQWLMPAARRRHPRFLAIFGRLFDRLPVRISTSDLHHRILRKKIYHIRAYDFGVQFSFNLSRYRVAVTVAKHQVMPSKRFARSNLGLGVGWSMLCSYESSFSVHLQSILTIERPAKV